MNNVTFFTDDYGVEHAVIDNGNETYTSMPKVEYDKQAEQSTPNLAD